MEKLEGKIALITGVGGDIGLATVKQFISEGAHVFIIIRPDQKLILESVDKSKITTIRGNVLTDAGCDRVFMQIMQKTRGLDIVFVNPEPPEAIPYNSTTGGNHLFGFDQARSMLSVVQRALQIVFDDGSIILNTVFTGTDDDAGRINKGAADTLREYARNWITNLKERHIRVNALNYGNLDTSEVNKQPLAYGGDTALKGVLDAITFLAFDESNDICGEDLQITPELSSNGLLGMGRTLQDVVQAVVFLASEDSSHITGMELFMGAGLATL